ncbi:glycosyltransferase family 4 protein [Oerskovia flava]|uniref:glycosyltransferase family 4 protein n=1 Tax=Oerskovia flava TaxID=2986422 RepID=UPI00223F8E9B|nr:glycosyltransferase family 4 protein [Oerskovia sp. JB1-3-2]
MVLRYEPKDQAAHDALLYARDGLALAAAGFPLPARAASTPYEPASQSVLSVLSQSLPIRSGGYATRTHGILSALASRGWDVAAITRRGFPYDKWPADDTREVPEVDTVGPIAYHRSLEEGRRQYPQHPLTDYVNSFADDVEALARDRRASVIHASSFYATGLGAAVAARRLGLPFVYELRGLEDLMRGAKVPTFRKSSGFDFISRMELDVCHAADAVLVITHALRDEMIARGVPAEKIAVLPNGVHVDEFIPRERDIALAEQLGIVGKTVIGYAGSIVHYEGLTLLMDAVAELAEVREDFAVVIVGDGADGERVRERAERRGLDGIVHFTGRVPHDEVGRYLSLFDIAPFPRRPLPVCELISPMKPFEAMATETAVVVSSVAALTEIVTDDETGLVFTAGSRKSLVEVLARMLDDEQLRSRLGRSGRAWVTAERDWSTVSEVVDSTYRALLGAEDLLAERPQRT